MPKVSAGILLYRRVGEGIEVLIAHPGGPLWAKRSESAWSIPKGLVGAGESLLETARREFVEETGFALPPGPGEPLGEVVLPSRKSVHAWAYEGDADPAALESNTFEMEWPPRSGRMAVFPEIDVVEWVSPHRAAVLLHPAQLTFVDRLLKSLGLRTDLDH
jgi:predicted NUDIX family NTP pyrophosphohydrolase